MRKSLSITLLLFAASLAPKAHADTIANGDFSAGNTGFSSAYTVSSTCSQGSPFGAGYYYIGTNPNACNGGWQNMSNSPGNGSANMMIVNNSNNATPPVVWSETLATTPGTAYTFTFWLGDIDMAAYNSSPATLELLVNGIVECTGYSSTTPGAWVQETCNYTSGAGTTETLALVDTNTTIVNGGDFALDNISDPLTVPPAAVPEPNTIWLLGSGLLGLMGAARRKWLG